MTVEFQSSLGNLIVVTCSRLAVVGISLVTEAK
jgi:hypothetical protein